MGIVVPLAVALLAVVLAVAHILLGERMLVAPVESIGFGTWLY